MKSLRYLNTVLTLIAILLTVQLWTGWHGSAGQMLDHAATVEAAGIPNAGSQRAAMLDELETMNKNIAALRSTLESDGLKVVVTNIDDLKADEE